MLTVSLTLDEVLRLLIAVGTFVFLLDIMYWVIRFGRDYYNSRAIVALALFFLMAAMATRQAWSVEVAALPVISTELTETLRTPNLWARLFTVAFAIFSTRFLRYAFRKDKAEREKEQNAPENRR